MVNFFNIQLSTGQQMMLTRVKQLAEKKYVPLKNPLNEFN